MEKKEANLLPNFCRSKESCSESSSSSSNGGDSDDEERLLDFANNDSTTNGTQQQDYLDKSDSSSRLKNWNSSPPSADSANNYDHINHQKRRLKRSRKKRMKIKQSKWTTYWNRYKRFLQSPRVHFVYDATFYCIFLMFFSYVILCEFTFYEATVAAKETDEIGSSSTSPLLATTDFLSSTTTTPVVGIDESSSSTREFAVLNSSIIHKKGRPPKSSQQSSSQSSTINNNDNNNEINENDNEIVARQIKLPSWIEYLLIYWMFAFMAEEARQVIRFLSLSLFINYLINLFPFVFKSISLATPKPKCSRTSCSTISPTTGTIWTYRAVSCLRLACRFASYL